jgi:hypothetical protein
VCGKKQCRTPKREKNLTGQHLEPVGAPPQKLYVANPGKAPAAKHYRGKLNEPRPNEVRRAAKERHEKQLGQDNGDFELRSGNY